MDLGRKDAPLRHVEFVGVGRECEAGAIRLKFNAVDMIGPAVVQQIFDSQRVIAVGGEGVVDGPFLRARVLDFDELRALGIEQTHEQIAGRAQAAGAADEHQVLTLLGREAEMVAIVRQVEAGVDGAASFDSSGLLARVVGLELDLLDFRARQHRERRRTVSARILNLQIQFVSG